MNTLHDTTFRYLTPTDDQLKQMALARDLYMAFVERLDPLMPSGPDKTYVLRQLRDCSMWTNIAITRNADGSQRGYPRPEGTTDQP